MNIYPKSFSKKNSSKLLKLLNFNNSFFYNDILPYDSDYCNYYDDIILEDDNNFENNFYQDDILNYFD